jgi:hypothetical protein
LSATVVLRDALGVDYQVVLRKEVDGRDRTLTHKFEVGDIVKGLYVWGQPPIQIVRLII